MAACPACHRDVADNLQECPYCGVIIAKWKGHIAPTAVPALPGSESNSPGSIPEFFRLLFGVKKPPSTQANIKMVRPHIDESPRAKCSEVGIPLTQVPPVCPSCSGMLEKAPGKKTKCPHCGAFMYVRTRPKDHVRVLVTEAQAQLIEKEIAEVWLRETGQYDTYMAEKQKEEAFLAQIRQELRQSCGREPSEDEVQLGRFNALRTQYRMNNNWDQYENVTLRMADHLFREGRFKEALGHDLEACYIGLNGYNVSFILDGEIVEKVTQVDSFRIRRASLPSAAIARTQAVVKRLGLSKEDLKPLFLRQNENIRTELMRLSPDDCWTKLDSALAEQSQPPGYYNGLDYTAYVSEVEALKRAGKLEDAAVLLLHLVDAAEAEAKAENYPAAAPWYQEQLGIVYRKMAREYRKKKDLAGEKNVLEQYLKFFPSDVKLAERLKEIQQEHICVSPQGRVGEQPAELKTISITATKITEHGKARFRLPDQFEGFVEQAALHHLRSEGWDGLWGENNLWWTLMALLFWDVIFAHIEGVWYPELGDFPGRQDMPRDFFYPEFYAKRQDLISDRLKVLELTDLNQVLAKAYSDHYGKPCRPIENWDKFSLNDLQNVIAHLPNPQLLSIMARLLKNFAVNRSGLPDLFIWKNTERAFAEVKGPHDRLSESQNAWFNSLRELGETVILVHVEEA